MQSKSFAFDQTQYGRSHQRVVVFFVVVLHHRKVLSSATNNKKKTENALFFCFSSLILKRHFRQLQTN